MSIEIYTYKDPYYITTEKFWEDIKCCPHFCSSQTLASGLNNVNNRLFPDFRLSTIKSLTNFLYEEWDSPIVTIKQYVEIDKIINYDLCFSENQNDSNLYRSFLFNGNDIFKSIRIMFELKIDPGKIDRSKLTREQMYIVKIYEKILSNERLLKVFKINDILDEKTVDLAIKNALKNKYKNNVEGNSNHFIEIEHLNLDTIVIQGIHKFTPITLKAIEEVSKFKRVILLFNYQSQYKNVYQTWINVYKYFESEIVFSDKKEFIPMDINSESYSCNNLSNQMGLLCDGKRIKSFNASDLEIIEFESNTEFAGYVAKIFQEAKTKVSLLSNPESTNALKEMKEQFYAADGSINEILKIYFPEQFEERKFLNYPIGHFFIALANMWNSQENQLEILDLNDVRECLSANVLSENFEGELINIFNKVSPLFEGCKKIKEFNKRIKRVRKNLNNVDYQISRLSYYSVTDSELEKLAEGFKELEDISNEFFKDFENNQNNFRSFYEKLKKYLSDKLANSNELDHEFKDIIGRVLERLNIVENINVSASFQCLKNTMSIYLQQEPSEIKTANWIVRNFEQIDGDILRSIKNENKIYHFACLSDEDINCSNSREFPWPLDSSFFNLAQNPIDWKYQVFVESSLESKNFKQYALLYGLEFNRSNVKLSYVKQNNKEIYYLFKMLGLKIKSYSQMIVDTPKEQKMAYPIEHKILTLSDQDRFRFKMCPYKFLLETIIENETIYKDQFLQLRYFEIALENNVRENLINSNISHSTVIEAVNDEFDRLKGYFPYILLTNEIDIINKVTDRLLKTRGGIFRSKTIKDKNKEKIKEIIPTNKINKNHIMIYEHACYEDVLQNYTEGNITKNSNSLCEYCANKDLCLEFYK